MMSYSTSTKLCIEVVMKPTPLGPFPYIPLPRLLKEWAAKEKVVLPYEHRGDSSIYQAEDFTQYLPPAAGGAGAGDCSAAKLVPSLHDVDNEQPR